MSEVLYELAAASRHWVGDAPTGAMLSAARGFLSRAAQDETLLREAAASLPEQEPGSVAWISVAFGTLVERGASAELTGPAVLDRLTAWLPELPAPGNEDELLPVPTPAQAMLLSQFQFLCQAAVTHLARLPAQRASMGQDLALLERLDELRGRSHGAWWVREALLKSSGTILLLHPTSGVGLQLRYRNVSHCLHLFSLLQRAVGARIPGGRDSDAAAAPAGTEQAWWHYGSPSSPKADLKASIRDEALVRDLPRVQGEQVMLLWPPMHPARQWEAGLLGPHLEAMPADAGVERMLRDDEAKTWLQALGIGRRKRWWPFV